MIIFDTETTGLAGPILMPLSKQPRIIELAMIRICDKTLIEKDRWSSLFNPGLPLPEVIQKITGLRDSDLKDAPKFSEMIPEIREKFEGEEILIAHNVEFDRKMLLFELQRAGAEKDFPWPKRKICTVASTLHVTGRRMNLSRLYEHCTEGGSFKDAHRAMVDTEALATCVRILIQNRTIIL